MPNNGWGVRVDYVVYGTGYGATLMLLGYALRTWGPKWRYQNEDERAFASGELRSAQAAWSRFTTGLGAVLATCGVILILFTFALMLANPGDDLSEMISLILSGLLLIGVAVWAWLYFSRFGAFGVTRSPDALTSYATGPIRYDDRQRQTTFGTNDVPAPDSGGPVGGTDDHELENLEIEDEVYEPDEDEMAEMEARFSKFETHHPVEGDDDLYVEETPVAADSQEDADDGAYVEAVADADDVQHADDDTSDDVSDDGVDVYLQNVEEPETAATEVASDIAAEEHVEDENSVNDGTAATPEVEEIESDQRPESTTPAAESQSGRDDALQRLRERQARRARGDEKT
jgi:hypothetical protein